MNRLPVVLVLVLVLLLAVAGCCPTHAVTPTGEYVKQVTDKPSSKIRAGADVVREVLVSFLEATTAQDFELAYSLLSGDLRARYSPERLALDHAAADPAPRNAVARIRASLRSGEPLVVEGDRAWLPLGGGLAVRFLREGETWRIAQLQ